MIYDNMTIEERLRECMNRIALIAAAAKADSEYVVGHVVEVMAGIANVAEEARGLLVPVYDFAPGEIQNWEVPPIGGKRRRKAKE